MKNLKVSRLYLTASLLLAVVGSLMLYGYLRGLEARVASNGRLVRLPVAATDIAAGSVIQADMLQELDFPDIYLLPSMLAEREELIGRVALRDIGTGDPFLAGSVSGSQEGGRAALMLGSGKRAYPVDTQENVVPLGDIRAGDRVDVIFVPPEGAAATILRSARVLCLPLGSQEPASGGTAPVNGFSLSPAGPSAGQLLLGVAPEEAETLAEAEERGKLVLAVCPALRE
jgi:Flp pilus assembly protein CpaB